MAELGYPGPGCLRGALLEARPPTLPRVRGARRDAIPGPQVRHGVSPLAPLRAWAGSLLLALLLGAGFRLKAVEGTEAGNFDAAAKEYTAGFWKQAEADFGEFAKKYPESTKLPEVFLCQAVARFHQTNYAGTIELLSNRQGQAGKWAEDYFFWRAKALQAKGDSAGAAEGFAKLIQQFPASGLCLEAGVEEARALAKLGDWARVIDLLQKPQGTFQNAVRTNASGEAVVSGWLLLGEAQFARQDYAGAEAAVKPLAALRPNPGATWPWQWHYLVSRLRVAQGHPEEALGTTSNLLAAAASAGDAGQLAESYAFVGGLFERLGRTEEAINAYTNNLAAGMPAERQAQALRKVTELLINADRLPQAVSRLEDFSARLTNTPPTDLALVLLGELRLKLAVDPAANKPAGATTNAPAATNALEKAAAALSQMAQTFTNSPLLGRAELDLGWCYWLQGKWPECQAACQAAVERLPISPEQATARFKLADALFEQKNYRGAVTQYNAVIDDYGDLPQVKTNLFESALYQAMRAGLAGGDLPAVTNALAKILAGYPNGFHTERAVLLVGQEIARRGDPAGARRMFAETLQRAPDSPLSPQIGLAIARTYEQENNPSEATAEYGRWLERFPTNSARPQAEFYLAMSQYLAGNTTNALGLMTNFVARYPADPLTPLAQWWMADYYYKNDTDTLAAERKYKEISQNTNLPPSDLTYLAVLMAGRSAVRLQDWSTAINHFTNLTSNVKCPRPIWVEAMFDYANTLVSQQSTNRLEDFSTAISVFTAIKDAQPTNRLAAAALGERANCYRQLAQLSGQIDQLTNAINSYSNAIAFPGADTKVRSMAEIGWGSILEEQARQKPDPERQTLLNQALEKYLHVFFRKNLAAGEPPDPFWLKKAGLEAARLAEDLRLWPSAINVYQELEDLLPPLRAAMERKILQAHEKAVAP